MTATPRRAVFVLFAAALLAPIACSSTSSPQSNSPTKLKRQELTFEVFFKAGDKHNASDCLTKDVAQLVQDHRDGVLFWDRESKIRIRPPHGKGREAYHVHVLHRVGDELLEKPLEQGEDGAVEVDMTKFGAPETLIVTTMPLQGRGKESPPASDRSKPIAAPFTLAFRLVPLDQAEAFATAQDFRYEWRHPVATLQLFVQPAGRDMLLTLYNPDRKGTDALDHGVFYWPQGDGFFAPRVTVEVSNDDAPWMRAAVYVVPEPTRRAIAKGEEPFTLRMMGHDLIRFAPPPTLDVALLDEHPATSARLAVRFAGMRPDSKLQLAIAAGYPVAGEHRVLVQKDEVTAEKTERTYVVSVDQESPSLFPLSGYVAWRAVEPWVTPGGLFRPRAPRAVFTSPLRDEEWRGFPLYTIAPRFASHYQGIYWFGTGRDGENELAKTLASWYWGVPDGGGSTSGIFEEDGITPNMTPPPWIFENVPGSGASSVYLVPLLEPPVEDKDRCGCWPGGLSCTRDTNGILGDQNECVGKCGKECPANGHCFPLAAGGSDDGHCGCWPGGAWCARDTNDIAGDEGECKGRCGIKCPANGHCKNDAPGKIIVSMLCMGKKGGCGKEPNHPDPKKRCNCPTHQWTKAALKEGAGKALADWAADPKENTEGYILADPGDPQAGRRPDSPHQNPEGHVPCHEETYVGMLKAQFWKGGRAVYVWFKLYVIFEPCILKPPLGGGGPGGGGGGGFGRIFNGDGEESGALGRVVPTEGKDPLKTGTVTARLNPSTDPNLAPYLADLVASTRRAFGASDVPPRSRALAWAVPVRVLSYSTEQWSAKVRDEAERTRKFDTVYWRPEKLKKPESSSTSIWYEGIWDRPVYLGADAQRAGGGGR